MPALAITGSIGSGKSRVLNLLSNSLEGSTQKITTFSADKENSRLLECDPEVKQLIFTQLGVSCYQSNGKPDRTHLFELISSDPNAKTILEQILHPRLENLWKPLAEEYRSKRNEFFVAEIPLVYEKGLEQFFDKILVVGCSDSVRRERLQRDRSLTSVEASRWMKMQYSQHEKISRADHLLWNDGADQSLAMQIQQLIALFPLS